MVYLLDVNVLLAFFDPLHFHHEPAHEWFQSIGRKHWATCPITENGFIRIASRSAYPNRPGDASRVLETFRQFLEQPAHIFWPDSKSILEMLKPGVTIHSSHVTDVYLLGLAVANGGKLATFDRKIPVQAVVDGEKAIEWLE